MKSVFTQIKTFPKERKVDSMNNPRSYIGIQTHTHTNDIDNNKDESSSNVVRTRKTFRWNKTGGEGVIRIAQG